MLNKLVLAAIATAIALPVAASEITPGRAMEAELLNLDASSFTLSELGQISSEATHNKRAERARFANRGVLHEIIRRARRANHRRVAGERAIEAGGPFADRERPADARALYTRLRVELRV